MAEVILPPLVQAPSPNKSKRGKTKIDLIVWHETAGSYLGAISWLRNPRAQASAHIVVREDGLQATQLVPIADKAWHCCGFNARAIGVEHANITAKGYATDYQLRVSARIFGWFCLQYGIRPRWARNGEGPGVCRHLDLGIQGCGHLQCGPDASGWQRFLQLLEYEVARGGYRKEWAAHWVPLK